MASRELIERMYGAWNRGEVDELASHLADGAVYETSGAFPGFEPTYRGPEGVRRFYETMVEAWEWFEIEILGTEPAGEMTVARIRFRARGRTSGAEVDLEFAHGFRIEGERVTHFISRATVDEVRDRIAEL